MIKLLLLLLLFSSCDIQNLQEFSIPHEFETLDQAWMWVADNIEYDLSAHPTSYPHPLRVYQERKADCKGYALLLAYFLVDLGYDIRLLEYDPTWSDTGHVIIYVVDYKLYIEPQIFGFYEPIEWIHRPRYREYHDILRGSRF